MRASNFSRLGLQACTVSAMVVGAVFAGQPIRVDISPDNGRRDHLTAEWNNWMIAPEREAAATFDGIKFAIRPSAGSDAKLIADWWKPGLAHDATMASDGVAIEGVNAGLVL